MKFLIAATVALLTGLSQQLKCSQGAVPTSKNICISPEYIQGCWQYASQNTCNICNYNYQLNQNGLCSYVSNTSQKCCVQYDRNGECAVCNRGLSLQKGVCKDKQLIGCLQKSQNGLCLNCGKGFILQNGQCLSGVKNCKTYNDNNKNICMECQENYSLVSNHCLKNKILGCKREQVGSCIQCYQPFSKSANHCEIDHCKSYSDFGCIACECGYYITKNSVCQKIQDGCIRHQKGHCTDCYPPFQLQGAVCVLDGCQVMDGLKCEKCLQEYQNDEGVCRLPNCLEGNNGKCKICKPGFNYQQGVCIKSTPKLVFN